jgi:uncharacterized protein
MKASSCSPLAETMNDREVAEYLLANPEFFAEHAEVLATIRLANPHGKAAVSLQERQMEMLRDKIKGLERQLVEMIRNGQDNVAIADKLHRWTRALMLTADAAELPDVLVTELQHQFQIPQAAIRVWGAADQFARLPVAHAVSDDVKSFAGSLSTPYCGVNTGFEAVQWLESPAQALSIALVPLHREAGAGAFGLLVLASPDPTRYSADMGTEFLARIGEVASAALSRLLPPM